jgi:hypothetical protein
MDERTDEAASSSMVGVPLAGTLGGVCGGRVWLIALPQVWRD